MVNLTYGTVEGIAVPEHLPVCSSIPKPDPAPMMPCRRSKTVFCSVWSFGRGKVGRRVEVKNLLVVGAGPIRRGQACEFNYAGVQGIAALKEEGIRMMAVIYDREDFASALRRAPQLSPVHEVLVERSVEKRSLSWK